MYTVFIGKIEILEVPQAYSYHCTVSLTMGGGEISIILPTYGQSKAPDPLPFYLFSTLKVDLTLPVD